jgi:hypothetical protein
MEEKNKIAHYDLPSFFEKKGAKGIIRRCSFHSFPFINGCQTTTWENENSRIQCCHVTKRKSQYNTSTPLLESTLSECE